MKPRAKKSRSAPTPRAPLVAEAIASRRLRLALAAIGALYLAGVWVEGVSSSALPDWMPRPIVYFFQIAGLFPHAATMSIEYRAEGWLCRKREWVEIDTRPYFPLDAADKENRFQRVMHFYRENRPTMQAVEAYLVSAHNEGVSDDGAPKDEIGGIRFLSLRLPLPKPGERVARPVRLPIAAYENAERHDWYWTPTSKRDERCRGTIQ